MQIEKIVLEKAADTLLEKAEDCFDLAKTQYHLAEKQHEGAAMQKENADKQIAIAAQQHCDAERGRNHGRHSSCAARAIAGRLGWRLFGSDPGRLLRLAVQDAAIHLPLPKYGHERTRLDR
jgi:hypothetical protein